LEEIIKAIKDYSAVAGSDASVKRRYMVGCWKITTENNTAEY